MGTGLPPHHMKTREKVGHLLSQRAPLDPKPASTLVFSAPASRNVRNECLMRGYRGVSLPRQVDARALIALWQARFSGKVLCAHKSTAPLRAA